MPKQQRPNGMPGKKPPAPSVKRRPVRPFSTLVEMLKRHKPRQADEAETDRRGKPVSGAPQPGLECLLMRQAARSAISSHPQWRE